MMSERIVDPLELIDVDVEQGELLAAPGSLKFVFDALAEQHPVRQIGQRVVMREMRYLLIGPPAIGDIIDDVDDVSGLPGMIGNPDAPGGDVALSHPLRLPGLDVQEQALGALQGFLVVLGDDRGCFLGKQIERRFADDLLAGHSKLRLGHAVGEHVPAIADVLCGNLGRNVIDDLTEEGVVAVALPLEIPALRYVLDRRHPPALRQGLVDDLKRASVRAFHNTTCFFSLCEILHDPAAELLDVAVERTYLLTMPNNFDEVTARFDDIGRNAELVEIAVVREYEMLRFAIVLQALIFVVEGSVEPMLLRFKLLLRLPMLPVHLPDDQEQNQGDYQRGHHGGADHEMDLRLPVREYGRDGGGGYDDHRKAAERGGRSEPVELIDGTFEAQRLQAAVGPDLL